MLDRKGTRERWLMARQAESSYNTRLRQVARQVDAIVRGIAPDGVVPNDGALRRTLAGYAEMLEPWAQAVARYMFADVARRNAKAWKEIGGEMSRALQAEIAHAPTGMLYSALQAEQVTLIKSLPLKAAERIHELTTGALYSSARPDEVAKEILRTGNVTASRATLIARTEVSRTASNLTQARAMFVGSPGYTWRTSRDADVRETHQAMEGKYVPWGRPPKTDKNLDPYHAGCGPNCRCYPDPVLPNIT
jgi:SPP1 gp7 family putative phage head morphogenesis protein